MPLVGENEVVVASRKMFAAAEQIVKIIENSDLPDGPAKAAIIQTVAIAYGMEAHESRSSR